MQGELEIEGETTGKRRHYKKKVRFSDIGVCPSATYKLVVGDYIIDPDQSIDTLHYMRSSPRVAPSRLWHRALDHAAQPERHL